MTTNTNEARKAIPKKIDVILENVKVAFEDAAWLEPILICTVKFMEYTPGGGLRQPAFKGLRDDKAPEIV